MYLSITFPVADFRSLHPENAGRLDRPAWGKTDPQAVFARGFGKIHTRTKSGSGFAGENYYADCDSMIKYPEQSFINPFRDRNRPILTYPIYRRFFFDGEMSGRFEFGFRFNEASLLEIENLYPNIEFFIPDIANQILNKNVKMTLLDQRVFTSSFFEISCALRDGWLLSSTKNSLLKAYDVETVGSRYVGVGRPYVFLRSDKQTRVGADRQKRTLINENDLDLSIYRSSIRGQQFDVAALQSKTELDSETAKERLARLFYTQLRTLAYAHSFYLRQVADGKIEGPTSLEEAIKSLIDRLAALSPLENESEDAVTCAEMRKILRNADIDVKKLTREIEEQVRPNNFNRYLGKFIGYFDRKADIAIEAAASTATKQILSSGP